MQELKSRRGDYVTAAQILTVSVLQDEAGSQRIADMVKLAEQFWRHRVVEAGQDPKEEALTLLEHALSECTELCAGATNEKETREANLLLATVKQGIASAKLVHNADRSEDELIETLLNEVLDLRRQFNEPLPQAETHNSLGMLCMKKEEYAQAENHFTRSLDIRM